MRGQRGEARDRLSTRACKGGEGESGSAERGRGVVQLQLGEQGGQGVSKAVTVKAPGQEDGRLLKLSPGNSHLILVHACRCAWTVMCDARPIP